MSGRNSNARTPGLRSNGNFRLYFSARIVSQLGDQLYVFAISWYVLDLTKSSVLMAALLALNALAVMAVAPFGGLIADRFSRKNVMVGTDIVQGVILVSLVALQFGHALSLGTLYAATVLLGLCSAVFSPAASALVPGIVGRQHVPAAVAATQAAENICTVVGMLLGGVLYKLVGIQGVPSHRGCRWVSFSPGRAPCSRSSA
jgi:MFS transporter, DHA3 family, macrolide efflux protein